MTPRTTSRTRQIAGAGLCAFVLMAGLTCTDAPTSPSGGRGPALVNVAPQFSLANAAVFDALPAFGLTVDNIHVHIDHPPIAPFDSVFDIEAGSDTVTLTFPLQLNGATEDLDVQIELRSGSLVLFSGTQHIVANAGTIPSTGGSGIPITYVGPGAGATSLKITPVDTAIRADSALTFHATALDSTGAVVNGTLFAWTVRNTALGSMNSAGTFTSSGSEGRTWIVAGTPVGLRDSVPITVTGEPARVVMISGNGQSGVAGTALAQPLVAQVQTSAGTPVPFVTVTFTAPATGGVNPASAVSDSAGHVQTLMTLGLSAGSQTFAVSAPGLAGDSIIATATAGAASTITRVAGDSQIVAAHTAVPVRPSVRLKDAHNNPVVGATVTFAVTAGGGSITNAVASTDSTGVAAVGSWTLGSSGAQTLTASAGSLSVAFTATVAIAPGAGMTTQLGTHLDTLTSLGDTLVLTATLRDTAGTVAAGVFSWNSRTPAIATVDTVGHVHAVANGSTWVVATESLGSKDSALIVVQQQVATVQITPGARTLYLGGRDTLSAAAVDGRGHPIASGAAFAWSSSNTSVVSVDSTGIITGTGIGATQVRATASGITGVADITILTPITRIEVGREVDGALVADSTPLPSLGDTRDFIAVAHDTLDAPMTGITFTWTSTNGAVATLQSTTATTTQAKALANGVTSIAASAQGVTGSANLYISQVLASIHITPDTLIVGTGGSGVLTAHGLDANGRFIAGKSFTYTSLIPDTATVNTTTGVVTGVALGTTGMVATLDSITSDTATVIVSASVPARISFGRDTLSIGRGSSAQVPVYLSRTNAQPVTVTLAVGDTAAYWSTGTVIIPAGQTAVNATLNGHNAATTFVTAVDGSGTGFAGDTAVLAVQATMKLATTSYSLDATDQVATQVLLSDPSPAGGTYVTFGFDADGLASVSPDPAFIPAGQLAADVQIRGLAAGTVHVTPQAIGVNGTPSSVQVYAAVVSLYPTSMLIGTGQVEPYREVLVSASLHSPRTFTLASSDSNVVRVPASATIATNSNYSYIATTALQPGTASITAAAQDWTLAAPMTVTVTTPHVGICCSNTITTTNPAQSVTLYSEDSTKSSHPRSSSLAVHLASSDPSVLQVLDTTVTIQPANNAASGRVQPGGATGTAYLIASAGGHTADSVLYTVNGPKLSLSWSTVYVGAGQTLPSVYVSVPNNLSAPLTVTLSTRDTTLLGVPASITIPTAAYYQYFDMRGKTPSADTIIATAPGYTPDTAVVLVTTPRVRVASPGSVYNFSAPTAFNVYSADSNSNVHNRTTPLTVALVSRNPAIVTIDSTTVTIPAGSYYPAQPAALSPVDTGTTWIIATADGHATDSASITVRQPAVTLSIGTTYLGRGQYRSASDFYVSTPTNRLTPLAVALTQSHPELDSLTSTSLTVPAGTYYTGFGTYAKAVGTDTIISSAPGYIPDTAFIRVTTPKFIVGTLPSSLTTVSPSFQINVYAADSTGSTHLVSDSITVHVVSSDSNVLRPTQEYYRIPAAAYYVTTTIVPIGPGSASITVSDSATSDYVPVTTNTATVTGPALAFSGSSVVLGMRQSTGTSGVYIYAPSNVSAPLTVNLVSTDPTVATVPATATIPSGSYYVYVPISAVDATGTVQIQATATGYTAASLNVQVTEPRFAISASSSSTTTAQPSNIYVYAEDANGTTHYTTEDVTVTLASSSPSVASIDSATVTIPSGAIVSHGAHWIPGAVGTAQISASDSRAATYKYATATQNVAVALPNLNFSWATMQLGVGQYANNMYAYIPNALASATTATLAHLGTQHVSTVPASTLNYAVGATTSYFRVIGSSAGTDSLTATMTSPLHVPDTAVVVVGTGRIDPIGGWPSALAVGDSVQLTIYARDPGQTARNVVAATTWTLTPSANIEFHLGGAVISSVTIPADGTSVSFYVKGVSAGTATASFTAPDYATYSNSFTVNP